MEDIPVDVSNKKYITASVDINEATPATVEPPADVELQINPAHKDPPKRNDTGKVFIAKLKLLRFWWAKKVEEFRKVQYPYLYGRFYDIYHFELVGYKPLDISLKVLILITILVVLAILIMVVRELINLVL